jgi:biopolymer transport protein TolR
MTFGRLERTPAPKPMSDINMTPLVDVMLVLVVIFILTAPLLATSLRLDLPSSAAAQPQEPARAVRLGLDKAGQVYLDDQPLALDALKERLTQIAQQNPLSEVQLWADQAAPYGQVVTLMGLAQQAGLSRIGFVASQK